MSTEIAVAILPFILGGYLIADFLVHLEMRKRGKIGLLYPVLKLIYGMVAAIIIVQLLH